LSEPSLTKNSFAFHGLQCTRGEHQLFNGLKATVVSGQCLHVTGANGSGKTSLLRILCGLSSSDSGILSWNDQPLNETFFDHSRYIGHKDALKNELTTIENLRFYQQMSASNIDRIHDDVLDNCLNQMQILQCADLTAQQLSFGQRRRLTFAKLLLQKTDLWILDEPFTGIDKDGRALIEHCCLDQLERGGMIILTHHGSLANSALASHVNELAIATFRSSKSEQHAE